MKFERRSTVFNVREAIALAWKLLWDKQVKQQQEEGMVDFKSGLYLTASDLERAVRGFAYDVSTGKEMGTHLREDGYSYTGAGIRIRGCRYGLLSECRDWLDEQRHNGTLECHNFARGHISGARYRVAGTEVSKAEQKSIAKRVARIEGTAPPHPVHFVRSNSRILLCREAAEKKRPTFGRGRWRRGAPRTSPHVQEVTCPRCLKLIAEQKIKTQPRKEEE